MGKRRANQKSGDKNSKKIKPDENVRAEDMYDEVDLFHKQRDKIPLDLNDDSAESDDDDEQPVFDYKGNDDSEDEEDDDEEDNREEDDDEEDDDEEDDDKEDDHEEDDDEEDDDDEDDYDKSFSKIERTQKYLKAKHGNLEDESLDDDDDDEDNEETRTVWGRRKSIYHDADNIDFELQSSDEGSAEEEEAEAIRLRKETAKSMTMEDFGIEDDEKDEIDAEPTFEKDASLTSKKKVTEDKLGITYEQVEKDLSSLSKDEQMDVVSSSAPELVGLLSELNDSLKQLDEVNPLISKVSVQKDTKRIGDLHYLEVKKLLLLAYSQAITFYLLLKSEGQPVRDHPVIARLVEIKSLLDKTKELDTNLPSQLEVLVDEIAANATKEHAEKSTTISTEHSSEPIDHKEPLVVKQKVKKPKKAEVLELEVLNGNGLENEAKRHDKQVSSQSVKMLSVRAALEEKLKQKGVFTTLEPNSQRTKKHKLRPHNSQLETFDDFGDDAVDGRGYTDGVSNGHTTLSNKVSQLISAKGKKNKVSGDEDLPQRDDLGERRRKHELRVLAGAGVISADEGVEDGEPDSIDDDADESEDELMDLHSAIANKISKTSEPETTLDGKRLITQQMDKNRGLTPRRKKLTKNPRKKYKLKHEKAKKRQTGQVRQVRRPEGPYGGESTGINAGVSRSIRFKG